MFARIWHSAMAGACVALLVTLAGAWTLAFLAPERPLTRNDMPHLFLAAWVLVALALAVSSRSALTTWRTALLSIAVFGSLISAGALLFAGARQSEGVSTASVVIAVLAMTIWQALKPDTSVRSPSSVSKARTVRR